jgi:hypothetical protein
MGKGYYIKKDNKDGLTLNLKKDQFIQYLQQLQGKVRKWGNLAGLR